MRLGVPRIPERMFAVVHLFRDQSHELTTTLADLGPTHHTIRFPHVQVEGAKLLRVFSLRDLLRRVRPFPVVWSEGTAAAARGYGTTLAAQRIGNLQKVARCEEGPILVFWPRVRLTFRPGGQVPQRPEGANEDDSDSAEGSGSDEAE